MGDDREILPGTGRWRAAGATEGSAALHHASPFKKAADPSTTGSAGGPPPRSGEEFTLSADRDRLDLARIHSWLADTYWSPGIARDTVERAIANSEIVGAYRDGEQIGFARLVTDHATFAYLADVYVAEQARGLGLGRALAAHFLDRPDLQGLRRWMLATADAHGVYARLGFRPLETPDRYMEIYNGPPRT